MGGRLLYLLWRRALGSGQLFPNGSALGAGPWVGVGELRGGTDTGRCGQTGSCLLGSPHQVKKLLTGPWGGGPQASGLRQDKGLAYLPGFLRALSVCGAPQPRAALSLGTGTGWEGQHGTGVWVGGRWDARLTSEEGRLTASHLALPRHPEEPERERKVVPAPMSSPCLISPRSRSLKRSVSVPSGPPRVLVHAWKASSGLARQ